MNTTTVAVKYQNVLLVDDNPMENMIHEKLMESNGFAMKISSSVSPKKALEFLSKAAPQELPEVIFLDIIMPEMDGFQFMDQFALLDPEIHKKCKIVLLSNSDSFKDLNRANKNRLVRKFLNKPLTPEMLAAINL